MITMLRIILKLTGDCGEKVHVNGKRHLSYGAVTGWINSYLQKPVSLPYKHVCQIGDPVLRAQLQPVEPEIIKTPAFQRVIKHMTEVMRTYKAIGLSANQVGLSYQMFVMELTEKHLEGWDKGQRKIQQIELIPLQVFVNPKMKIVDYGTVKHSEECLSILGYSAVVPRAKTVRIEALDASGKPVVYNADGWAARIVQHEMDHLQGKVYIDRMDPSTFSCEFWRNINMQNGHADMRYYPTTWFRRVFRI